MIATISPCYEVSNNGSGVKLMWKSNKLLTYKQLVRLQLHQNATLRYSSLYATVCLSINNFIVIVFVNRVRDITKITTTVSVAGTRGVKKRGGICRCKLRISSASCNF